MFVLSSLYAAATHNRAGEIIYRRISGFTYEVTIITYTKESAPVERPALLIDWGDNTGIDTLRRTFEDNNTYADRDVTINRYRGVHNFAGPGRFIISVEDPNRNNNILNLIPPNGQSDQVVFYIESELVINPFAPANVGPHNNSAVLLNPPIDQACLGQPYRHNPGAFDPDGDSLVYSLVPNRVEGGNIPDYYISPSGIAPGPNNNISINARTGDLVWDAPQQAGQYNIAILIEEFRNGLYVGSVLRDMQITVETCDNIAPEISLTTLDTCVVAGSSISIPVSASDENGDNLVLTASGLPFEVNQSPASFSQSGSTTANFGWSTICNHVRKSPYQVVVKAEDQNSEVKLVDFKSFQVTVIGPPVQNVSANVVGGITQISWSNYNNQCTEAVALKVYRRAGATSYVRPLCTTGMPDELGYELIATLEDAAATSFTDTDTDPTTEFCYRLVACFADGAESVVSDEACTQIRLDVPIMTHVSVGVTDNTTGVDTIRWAKPQGLDTLNAFPPPYRFKVLQGVGFANATTEIGSTPTSNTFGGLDTTFIARNLGTQDTANAFRVVFESNGNDVGTSGVSSSIFLESGIGDEVVRLSWTEEVNWGNFRYIIERLDPNTQTFDSIGTSIAPNFEDRDVVNDSTYCYRVRALGAYSNVDLNDPFINFSQELCATPVDNEPPCPPVLQAIADCELENVAITWEDTNFVCAPDVAGYNLYYKTTIDGDFEQIESFPVGQNQYTFTGENTVAGCFYITAIDDNGNESLPSNIGCTDNCPAYQLPDVMTPNGDGFNDVFRPFSSKFVRNVQVEIFNRWGKLVFETTDPQINWNGNYRETQQPVAEGTYFYVINLEVLTLEGLTPQNYSGYITLLR